MKKILATFCLLFSCLIMLAQTSKMVTVSGTILGDDDEPLIGATIYVKDRTGGTITDLDGNFTVKASIGDKLIINSVGYETEEKLLLKDEIGIVIKMKKKDHALEELVVTAMGTSQKKISVVGAVTNVDVESLQVPATSISNMLGGRVAGIINKQYSGEPGKNISEFWIRGIGTFGANSSALVLIDGVEGSLNNVDPADIESFSVLKDASATAVYGVRGANGVVLIKTKSGLAEKLTVTARANFTVSRLNKMPTYLGAYDYAKLANEANSVRGGLPLYDNVELDIIKYGLDPDIYPNVNWRDEILNRTSFQQTYYVSARGGGSLARYFLSLGMSDEGAAYKQDPKSKYSGVDYKTYNYRANIDMNLTKTTTLRFGADGYFSNKQEPGNANTDNLWSAQANLTPLTIPTKYSTGELPAYGPDDLFSPYVMLNHTGLASIENRNFNTTLSIVQDLEFITKGLSIRAMGALTQDSYFKESRYNQPTMYYATGRNVNGSLLMQKKLDKKDTEYSNEQGQFKKIHFESAVNYERLFNEIHRVSGLLYYYMSEQRNTRDINFDTNAKANISAIPIRYQGISSRFTYGLKDTYFLDANFGYTGSENFKPGEQFGFFPSVAVGWVPTGYDFVKENLKWLDFLKIRASYGLVGNDRISSKRFAYQTLVNDNSKVGWSGSGGISESTIGADNLVWEKAKKMDIGIEGKLLDERIDFVVDFFNDQRDGIFQQRTQIPEYVGLPEMPYGNVGKMKSFGYDGNISFTQKINNDLRFVIRGNFTYAANEIQNWEQAYPKYEYQAYVGWPYQIQRGYISMGLFKDDADIANSPKQTFGNYLPGDIKYKDVNGDGIIDSDDQVPLSYPDFPRLMYGFGGEVSYKKWTLGVLFKGTGRTDIYYTKYENGKGYIPFLNGKVGNVLDIVNDQANRWTPESYSGTKDTENPNAKFPRLSYGNNQNNSQISTFWRDDAKYLRLQEVSLNYNLKERFLKKVGVSSIDIQLLASDLYVWDKIKHWDPELATYNGEGNSNGISYPIPTRFTLQLYINF